MANVLFLYDNKALGAGVTIAASSQASTSMVAANLLDPDPGIRWRATGSASETVTLTFPSVVDLRWLALINHNLSLAAQVIAEIAEVYDGAFTTTVGPQDAWTGVYGLGDGRLGIEPLGGYPSSSERADMQAVALIDLGSVVGCKQLRLTITDPDNPDGYVTAGVLFADAGFTPERNMSFDWRLARVDPSTQIRLEAGGARAIKRTSWRTLALPFGFAEESDAIQFFGDMERLAGLSGHVLITAFPGAGTAAEQRTTLYGLLAGIEGVQNWTFGLYRTGVTIQEVRG